jgi:hypothetical protein
MDEQEFYANLRELHLDALADNWYFDREREAWAYDQERYRLRALPDAELVPEALEKVNEIRIALAIGEGKLPELPKGQPGEAEHCVIAKALSNGWVPSVNEDEITLRHPWDENFNWEAAVEALIAMGIKPLDYDNMDWGQEVVPKQFLASTIRKGRKIVIVFQTPIVLAELISRFDREELPQLIEKEIVH